MSEREREGVTGPAMGYLNTELCMCMVHGVLCVYCGRIIYMQVCSNCNNTPLVSEVSVTKSVSYPVHFLL